MLDVTKLRLRLFEAQLIWAVRTMVMKAMPGNCPKRSETVELECLSDSINPFMDLLEYVNITVSAREAFSIWRAVFATTVDGSGAQEIKVTGAWFKQKLMKNLQMRVESHQRHVDETCLRIVKNRMWVVGKNNGDVVHKYEFNRFHEICERFGIPLIPMSGSK